MPAVALQASGIDDEALQVGSALIAAVGGTGTMATGAVGVTAAEGAEAGPVPRAFVAVTVNVYVELFESPAAVHERAPVVVHVAPPGAAVAV